ncbi:MAG: target of Sbf, partial [Chaenotheca gracillima]
ASSRESAATDGHLVVPEGDDPFIHIKSLGVGGFGVVDMVRGKPSSPVPGRVFARKTVLVGSQLAFDEAFREVQNVKRLKHPHIITVALSYEEDVPFKRSKAFRIIMEPVADMNLADFLGDCEESTIAEPFLYPDSGSPEGNEIRQQLFEWFGCLVSGVAFLHENRVRHRDIKPTNILVKGTQVLFTDFGSSKGFGEEVTMQTGGGSRMKTKLYAAPEVGAGRPRGKPSDIYSLGCVFAEMFTVLVGQNLADFESCRGMGGSTAYHIYQNETLRWLIYLRALSVRSKIDQSYLREAWTTLELTKIWVLVAAMLEPRPETRPDANALVSMIKATQSGKRAGPPLSCRCLSAFTIPPGDGQMEESGISTAAFESSLHPGCRVSWEDVGFFWRPSGGSGRSLARTRRFQDAAAP